MPRQFGLSTLYAAASLSRAKRWSKRAQCCAQPRHWTFLQVTRGPSRSSSKADQLALLSINAAHLLRIAAKSSLRHSTPTSVASSAHGDMKPMLQLRLLKRGGLPATPMARSVARPTNWDPRRAALVKLCEFMTLSGHFSGHFCHKRSQQLGLTRFRSVAAKTKIPQATRKNLIT